jgi:hypothetical protein
MEQSPIKSYSLTEMKDKYIGKPGTPDRDKYEENLYMDVLKQKATFGKLHLIATTFTSRCLFPPLMQPYPGYRKTTPRHRKRLGNTY